MKTHVVQNGNGAGAGHTEPDAVRLESVSKVYGSGHNASPPSAT